MKLRRNQLCPIHRSLFCCGREQIQRQRTLQPGIRRVEDPHHPRGYRELRSPAEMRKLLNRKIRLQGGICAICHDVVIVSELLVASAPSATRSSLTITTSCPTTGTRKGWAEPGATTIQTTFRPRTTGVTTKRDRQGSNDYRPISRRVPFRLINPEFPAKKVCDVCALFRTGELRSLHASSDVNCDSLKFPVWPSLLILS
jgi:hypothetical protein